MHRDGVAEGTECAKVSPVFMKATLGPKKHTVYLQRGFRQYGQPLPETLAGMVKVNFALYKVLGDQGRQRCGVSSQLVQTLRMRVRALHSSESASSA